MLFLISNFCVSNCRDKLELKAVKDGAASYAALEKKAELYDKLARGELSDEEDKEKYCVDFFSKSLAQDEPRQPHGRDTSHSEPADYEDGENEASVLPNNNTMGLGRAGGVVDFDEHKRLVRYIPLIFLSWNQLFYLFCAFSEEQFNAKPSDYKRNMFYK